MIAVCALSGDLFPGRAIGTRPMAISVAVMNLGTCLFGAMPSCHGSGGLAGQHRFGARTGGSMVVLGLSKMGLGILFGSAVGVVLAAFPSSLLGVLLAFAGLELGLAAREESGPEWVLRGGGDGGRNSRGERGGRLAAGSRSRPARCAEQPPPTG